MQQNYQHGVYVAQSVGREPVAVDVDDPLVFEVVAPRQRGQLFARTVQSKTHKHRPGSDKSDQSDKSDTFTVTLIQGRIG